MGKGLSATDVSNALNLQNLILPTGTVKVGTREYLIRLNSSPELISAMNDMPIKTVNGAPVYLRDVGTGPRRVSGADQHCSHQWRPRHRC